MDKLQQIKLAFENDNKKVSFGERLRFDHVEWLISEVERLRENQEKIKPFIQLFNENFGTNLTIGSDEVNSTFGKYYVVSKKTEE